MAANADELLTPGQSAARVLAITGLSGAPGAGRALPDGDDH